MTIEYLIASRIDDSDIPDRAPDYVDDIAKHWKFGGGHEFLLTLSGTKLWLLNGKRHREDGPAIILINGTREWYLDDELHREDGPAVERSNGTKEWYVNGRRHREDGPANDNFDGTKEWYVNGRRHREDGPAVERSNGTKEWYLNGKRIKSKDFDSPQFQKRWQKLVDLERVRQVMEV